MPLTLEYLDPTKYGIWLTLSSIISFFTLFDIGLGNGLRNKLAEALAINNKSLAKSYVSTTYFIIFLIVFCLLFLFLLLNPLINWIKILNSPVEYAKEINYLVFFIFIFFIIQFVVKLITTILTADQKPAYTDLFNFISNIISLIIVLILKKVTEGSILYLGICLSATPVFVLTIATIYFFSRGYKEFIPNYKFIELRYIKDLTSLGMKFFLIQISFIIIFSTNNLIITQIFGPSKVTPYNIAYKYFSIITMVFTIVLSPIWSGFTDAYVKNDFLWIKYTMKKILRLFYALCILTIILIIISNTVYSIWLGTNNAVYIPLSLSISMGIFVIITNWITPFTYFVNGVGKIKLQLYLSYFLMLANIPLSYFLAKYCGMGVSGVVYGTSLCLLPFAFVIPIQYRKILNFEAKGIWNK